MTLNALYTPFLCVRHNLKQLDSKLHRTILLCFFLVLPLGLGGCAAARWESPPSAGQAEPAPPPPIARKTSQQLLYEMFNQWQGTPYRYGGNSTQGIDCSAFSQRVVKEVFGVQLPRTTLLQLGAGREVQWENRRVGDLVFFDTALNTRHVGVMVDTIKFMHAGQSRGVSLSRLDDDYWRSRLISVRRVSE